MARFNSLVTKPLLEGAHEVFHRHGVDAANVDVRGAREGMRGRVIGRSWGSP